MTNTVEPAAKQILIVEDETIVAMDLAINLKKFGYIVAGQAQTVDQALIKAEQLRPDLVLMDIKLKGAGSGVTAASAIRERWNIPVVFVTANTNLDTIASAKASGPYGFISKPFRPRELDATIGIALNQHKLTRALFAERSWVTQMMASLSDGVIATDADGFVRYLNPAAEAIIGWSASEAIGLPIERVYPLSTMTEGLVEQCQLRKALATREPIGKERFLVQVKGGHKRPVEDSAAPIIEGGQLLGAITIFLDITERLAKEQHDVHLREKLEEQVHVTTEALGNTRQELQALAHHLMTAQDEERARIARELHDDLGQRTVLLGMKMQTLESAAPASLKPQALSVLDDLVDLSNGLRGVSHRLHSSVLADLGLKSALESLVRDFRNHGYSISLHIEEIPPLSIEVSTAFFRIAQEALSNVRKHAPGAPVEMRVWQVSGTLQMCVQDEGTGFSLANVRQKGGFGLISMHERARVVGGTLLLNTSPGQGTSLLVRVPLQD